MPSAQRVWWAKVRTSAVILAALTILAVLVYLLTGGHFFEKKASVYLYVPDGSGLVVGSPVRDDGVDVGKVSLVEFAPSGNPQRVIRVTLSIDKLILARIPADSDAQLSADSLVGDMFVDISSGTAPQRLQPGGEIAYKEQAEILKTLDLQQFEQAIRSVDATLTDIEQGKSRVGQFVMGTGFYDDLRKDLRDLDKAFHQAAGTAGMVGRPLYTTTLYRSFRDPIVAIDRSLAAIQAGQGTMGGLLRDNAQYEHFRTLAGDIRNLAATIRSGPLIQSDSNYNNFNTSLSGLIRAVDQFNTSPLLLNSSVYDNLNGVAKGLYDAARSFHTNPKAYMRVQVF